MNFLDHTQRLYIVGIKGVGMTALAQLLAARGHQVSGSDVTEIFFTDAVLREHHIPFIEGFSPANLPESVDAVIFSTAYTLDHPELAEARRRGVPLYTYPEMLGELLLTSEGISVAGTHGKTTTTALLGAILADAGLDPTVIVGSYISSFHGNARIGHGKLMVVETDEYQNKFTHYRPKHAIVTNIEYDHPDFFANEDQYVEAFFHFLERLPGDGILVTSANDGRTEDILRRLGRSSIRFGTTGTADVRMRESSWQNDREVFVLEQDGKRKTFAVRMPGVHNALNATAAIAFARALGVSDSAIRSALESFDGIKRRFEFLGSYHGASFFDDYAHHPTELAAAIASARERFPGRRLIAVFQPHTYSRTRALLPEFARVLDADDVVLLEVYGSAREHEKTVSSRDVIAAMPAERHARLCPTLSDAAAYLERSVQRDDVVLLLGAGDAWKLGGMIGVRLP